ncbi:MAG TPA: phosphoribosyltransferase family protein, partial [Candidatus Saccharimonadales bacterium]|nr:phosphoribosyltransferase family protein [Candidatus Saccharimonadales bacterium]
VAKKLIFVLKYQPYVSDIQHILVDLFYESLIQKELFTKNLHNAVFIPIPLSAKKLKLRGYNQSLLLAKGLAKKMNIPLADILIRTKNTKPQFGLSKLERKINMKDAFALKKRTKREYETAFLVDDVLTTGTTLSEAAKILKQHGFQKVWGVTFARD